MPRSSAQHLVVRSTLVLLASAGAALAQNEIFSNGSTNHADPGLSTGATTSGGIPATPGFTWSEVQNLSSAEANAVAGFSSHAYSGGAYRFADDFTVPPGRNWRLDAVALFAYQTGAPLPPGTSPFASLTVRIWSGVPDGVGSTILLGDATTNRLTSSVGTTMYRVFNGSVTPAGPAPDTARLIWKSSAILDGVVLGPGVYWLDWQYTTTATDGVAFSPAVTVLGQRTKPGWNALQLKTSGWTGVTDPGKPDFAADLPQDFPFIFSGLDACLSDFNLDGDINPDDLGDFITCYFGTPPCNGADFNHDGDINPDDLGDFITTYFAGC